MTPRVDVVALTIPVTADAVAEAVRESGHSCFPVVHDDLDDLVGVLFVNDLFRATPRRSAGEPDRALPARHLAADPPALRGARVPPGARRARRDAPAAAGLRGRGRRVRRRGRRPHREGPPRAARRRPRTTSSTPTRSPRSSGSTPAAGSSTAARASTTSGSGSASRSPTASTSRSAASSSTASGTSRTRARGSTVDGWELRVVEMDKRRIAKVLAKHAGRGLGRRHPATASSALAEAGRPIGDVAALARRSRSGATERRDPLD